MARSLSAGQTVVKITTIGGSNGFKREGPLLRRGAFLMVLRSLE